MADAPCLETPPVLLTPPGAFSADEAKLFHEIGRRVTRLPEGIDRLAFRFSEDSTGAPAVWIVFVGPDDLKPSNSKISDIVEVAKQIQNQVFASGSERYPYFEVVSDP